MCPACIVTAAFVIAGGSSAGGLTIFTVKKLSRRKNPQKISKHFEPDAKKKSV